MACAVAAARTLIRSVVGWKYEEAFEESQKYKVGKFILEKPKIDKAEWLVRGRDAQDA